MGIEYFTFGLYLLISFYLIPRIPFIKHADVTGKEVRFLLGFKMISSLVFAFYFKNMSSNFDYLGNNIQGTLQYGLLLRNPLLFFTDFTSDIHTYGLGRLFESQNSFWGYLRFNLLYKFIAILNLVTKGNFYFNTIIFSSMAFFGHIAFYRVYSTLYKGQKLKILFACFLLPSVLLYTSCVHKDGVVFLSLGLSSYIFYRILSSPKSLSFKYIFSFFLGMLTIFLFRNYVIVAIVPAMLLAVLCKILSYRRRFIFLTVYSLLLLLFFLSGYNKSFLNLPGAVVQRKADFAALGEANTNIPMNELYPTVQSFVLNLPQAVNHFLFRPYLWEFSSTVVILTALELFFYQTIIIGFIFFRKKNGDIINNFNLFGFAFFINMMLIIGYTIPNIGAIVRYRSIFWVFLLCPLLCNTDWQRFLNFRKPAANHV